MSWQIEIPIITRVLINDLSDQPEYSDDRLLQLITIAAQYVKSEINLVRNYDIDIINQTITPDPSNPDPGNPLAKDSDYIGFIALKSACLLDQSTLRTRAAMEGVRASLGPAVIQVAGNIRAYQILLEEGPCNTYQELRKQYEFGNANAIRSMMSPFVGNKFDPRAIQLNPYRSKDIYS
jgi:hypothetical protein